jgi:hypothetical protein
VELKIGWLPKFLSTLILQIQGFHFPDGSFNIIIFLKPGSELRLTCPSLKVMLSYLRAFQSFHAQSQTHHPGCHHPGDHSMLLFGGYCQAISPASENSNTHFNHHPNIDHRGHEHEYTHIHNDPISNSDNYIDQYSYHPTSFQPDFYLYINIYLDT